MGIEQLPFDECQWLKHGGRASELVLSSRIRLARNIRGIPFSHWASSGSLEQIIERVTEALPRCLATRDMSLIRLDQIAALERDFLLERHLISREMAAGEDFRLVAVGPDETLSIMVNEEDHLRLQCLASGLELRKIWQRINEIDDQLDECLNFAFSPRWGYLTACPTNVGTGIRCSVMVHLPALVLAKQVERVLGAVTQLGLTVRGIQGEGSEISGSIAQLSNQVTLGVTEEESIEKLERMTEQIIGHELEAQRQMMHDARAMVEDKVFRAYGILKGARIISSRETVELVSALRLGRTSGILSDISYKTMNEILICSRPAHLQKIAGKKLEPTERDVFRAHFIRERLN